MVGCVGLGRFDDWVGESGLWESVDGEGDL